MSELEAELRAKVIDAVCFKPDIEGHIEQFERIEALLKVEVAKAKLSQLKELEELAKRSVFLNGVHGVHLETIQEKLAEVESNET